MSVKDSLETGVLGLILVVPDTREAMDWREGRKIFLKLGSAISLTGISQYYSNEI